MSTSTNLSPEKLLEAAEVLRELAHTSGILTRLVPHGHRGTEFQKTANQLEILSQELVPVKEPPYRWR